MAAMGRARRTDSDPFSFATNSGELLFVARLPVQKDVILTLEFGPVHRMRF
jgi:hypothetical protein